MKIGVIADTHIPALANKLPQKVYDYFKDCDLIIHAGDLVEASILEELEKIAETKAVWGNMDSYELKRRLPEKIVLDVAGKKIGVVHGRGPAFKVIKTVSEAFSKKPDIIIFGHSHTPFNEKKGDTLFFNPGSATDNVFPQNRSFGIIEIDGDNIRAEIIKIED
jgi:putative phosphoesterase